MKEGKKELKGIYLVLIATFFWGFLGISSRILHNGGLSVTAITFFRCFLSVIGIVLWSFLKNRAAFKVDKKGLIISAFYGIVGFIGCFFLYNFAVSRVPVSVVTVLLFTGTVWVILFDAILFKEPITTKKIVVMIVTIVGCILVANLLNSRVKLDFIGILAGLGTGVSFCLQLVIPKCFEKEYKKDTLIIYGYIFACIFIGVFTDFGETYNTISNSNHFWTLVLNILSIGFLSTFISNTFYVKSTEYITASLASILAAMEPVLSSIFAWILLGEVMNIMQIIGAFLVILAALILETDFEALKDKVFNRENTNGGVA